MFSNKHANVSTFGINKHAKIGMFGFLYCLSLEYQWNLHTAHKIFKKKKKKLKEK